MDLEPDQFDSIVVKSPTKVHSCFQVSALIRADSFQVRTSGITESPSVCVRELGGPDGSRPLEINSDDGQFLGNGIDDFMFPQPIVDRMAVSTSPPKESSRIRAGLGVIAQSTPTTLPRGPPQSGRVALRKPRVTFATSPFEEKEALRSGPHEITPGSGTRRRTIFEDNMLGTRSAWKRTPEKGPENHSALIGVRSLASILRKYRGRTGS